MTLSCHCFFPSSLSLLLLWHIFLALVYGQIAEPLSIMELSSSPDDGTKVRVAYQVKQSIFFGFYPFLDQIYFLDFFLWVILQF